MKKYMLISKIFYLLAIFNYIFFIAISSFNILEIKDYILILATLVSCSLIYMGGHIVYNKLGKKGILKINLYIYFTFYLLLLIFFLFINPLFGRSGTSFNNNFIPFQTIKIYLNQFNSLYESKVIMNLLGNFICIMPFAFFAKYLFKNTNIVLLTIFFVIGIEFLQYLTNSGSFDVDDIILNSTGAVLMYLVLKIKPIDKIILSIFLKINRISKKEVSYLALTFTVLLFSFITTVIYKKDLYDKNLDHYNSINNPSIRFVYDTECSTNNLFYEDEIYFYYFECFNSNNFNTIVNNQEKMSITKLIDDSKYEVNIERIIWMMKYQHINYYIKHKYQYFDLEITKKSGTLSTSNFFKNEYVKLVLKEKENTTTENLLYEVNIIPLKSGASTVKLNFDFSVENNLESVIKYIQIDIDDNLKATFKVIE